MSEYKIEISLYGSCGTIQVEALTVNWRDHPSEKIIEFQPMGLTEEKRIELEKFEKATERSVEVKITKPHEILIIGGDEVTHVSDFKISNLKNVELRISAFRFTHWFDVNS